jgi:hypothetical protein
MLRRSVSVLSISLLVLAGAACGGGEDEGADLGAARSDEPPSEEFCALVMEEPSTSAIDANIAHYEGLKPVAPEDLEDDLDAIVKRYEAHAADGELSTTISADAEAQPHLMEVVSAALRCPR